MTADLTVRAAAEDLSVSPETVRRYIREGLIRAYRTAGSRSQLRIEPQALADYRQQQREPDPWVRSQDR